VTLTPTVALHLSDLPQTIVIHCHLGLNAYNAHLALATCTRLLNVAADGAFVYCCAVVFSWFGAII